jgi:hypothetical protein
MAAGAVFPIATPITPTIFKRRHGFFATEFRRKLCALSESGKKLSAHGSRHHNGAQRPGGRFVKRPVVQIEISRGKHARTFLAIIDSGADNIILPAYIAELFGIDRGACRSYSVMGISLESTPGFIAELDFHLQNHSDVFTAPVVFIDKDVPPLLGQEGFFDNYRIKFEKDHDTFEIASPPRR